MKRITFIMAVLLLGALWPSSMAIAGPPNDVTDLKLASLKGIVGLTGSGCYVESKLEVKNVGDMAAAYSVIITLASESDPTVPLYAETIDQPVPLVPRDNASYLLATSTWIVTTGKYVLSGAVTAAGDQNARNDTQDTRVTCR